MSLTMKFIQVQANGLRQTQDRFKSDRNRFILKGGLPLKILIFFTFSKVPKFESSFMIVSFNKTFLTVLL